MDSVSPKTSLKSVRETFTNPKVLSQDDFNLVGLTAYARSQSRGFCFVELESVREASMLIQNASALYIDGAQVSMAFARPKDVSSALSTISTKANSYGQNAVEQVK